MIKLTTKEDVALLVAEASEMFEETGCVPDVDGAKVPAETIVPHAKQYILETIDNPKASYNATIWHSPGYFVAADRVASSESRVFPHRKGKKRRRA